MAMMMTSSNIHCAAPIAPMSEKPIVLIAEHCTGIVNAAALEKSHGGQRVISFYDSDMFVVDDTSPSFVLISRFSFGFFSFGRTVQW